MGLVDGYAMGTRAKWHFRVPVFVTACRLLMFRGVVLGAGGWITGGLVVRKCIALKQGCLGGG